MPKINIKKLDKTIFLVLIATLIALLIRMFFLNLLSVRLDEAQSVWQSSLPIIKGNPNLLLILAQDVHPPLFGLILHFWMLKFGTSAESIRTLPFIFNVLTIPLIYLLGKEIYSKSTGVVAAFVAALSPIWIWYSAEARNYTLFLLLATLSYYFFFKILKKRGNRNLNIILYYLIQVLGVYTHYFFFFIIFIELIGAVLYKKKLQFLIINLLAAIPYSPWIYYFLKYHLSSTQPNLGTIQGFNIILTYFQVIVGYHNVDFYTVIIAFWPLLILLAFTYIKSFNNIKKDSIILGAGVILPIVITFIISEVYISLLLTRYVMFITVFLFIIIAKLLDSTNEKYKIWAINIFLVFMLFITFSQMVDPLNIQGEDYSSAISYIQDNATSHDLIVVSAPFTIYPFEYYYKGNVDYVTLPYWDRNSAKTISYTPSPKQMEDLISASRKKYDNMYLIESFDQKERTYTTGWFNNHLQSISHQEFGYNIIVNEYKLRY